MNKRHVNCVFGCSDLGAYMHRFPHPERRAKLFIVWLEIVGEKLKESDPLRIYKNKMICDYHFKPEHKVSGHRLLNTAVPSLYLSGVVSSDGISVQLEHYYFLPRMWGAVSEPITNVEFDSSQTSQEQRPMDDALQARLKQDRSIPSTSQSNNKGYNIRESSKYLLKQHKASQKDNKRLRRQLKKANQKSQNYKTRLANAEKVAAGQALNRVTKNMTSAGKLFTGMQYRQGLKAPKGRRYTLEEKIMALTFFKKSPKLYTLLYKWFRLPSSKSLRNLLREIKISPGSNKIIFENLKDTVCKMNVEDRLCTLIFDEMSLTPNIQYDAANDELKGFVTGGEEIKIANHALVFMVKGIKMNFKQPVAYYFTQSLHTNELKGIIVDIIRQVHCTGLKILCSVCDQGTTNVSAINSLVEETKAKYLRRGKEWREEMYEVDSHKIIPLYDVPHLLKGLRNNLLTKDLKYTDFGSENKTKIVKWEYFQMLYEADKNYGELRYLHKLTEEHINPGKIKKMRVKLAAQVFSHSVAVATEHLTGRKNLPEECRQLIPVVLLLDKLFDSLNAGTFNIVNGKVYRGGVKKNTPHHKLWQESIHFLKNVTFIARKRQGNKVRIVETSAPSLKNLIKTIEGVQALWNILHKKYSFDCLLTRNLNQDPVEIFFGNIRSLGVRNVSPNSRAFEGAFKTLLLNNFSSVQAVNANCEEDFNNCLQTLDFFITQKEFYDDKRIERNIEVSEKMVDLLYNDLTVGDPSDYQQRRYVCGWVLSKCLSKIVKSCKACRTFLLSQKTDVGNEYIRAKEYNKNKQWLCYPSNQLANSFNEVQEISTTFLKSNFKKNQTKENIKMFVESFVTFPSCCDTHSEEFKNTFIDSTINILIYSWCRSINRILSGKISYKENNDPIKQNAQMYYDKHKHK